MAITIKGVRIKSITVSRDEEGADHVRCDYQLVSSADKVLANQSLNSKQDSKQEYGGTPFVPPSDVLKALSEGVEKYKQAVEVHLGLS